MKCFLTTLTLLITIQALAQSTENPTEEPIQEGTIYHFGSRKHACGQLYYIALKNDTIAVGRSIEKKIDFEELPIEIYLTISGDDRCWAKTLSYIERK